MWNPSVEDSIIGFFKAFIGEPSLLVGVFALLGCILQRKNLSQTITGVVKVVVGFLIIGLGAGGIKSVVSNLFIVLENAYGLGGTSALIPSNEVILTYVLESMPNIVTTASLILILGMVANTFLAKFSRLKYIYLTGHLAFYMALALASVEYAMGMRAFENAADTFICILSGMFLLGFWMCISPALNQKFARKILGHDKIALAHTGGILYAMSGLIGLGVSKLSKKPIKSTEEINVKKSLMFLTDGTVAIALTMVLIYAIVMWIGLALKGLDAFNSGLNSQGQMTSILGAEVNWGVAIWFPLLQGLTFSGGVQILIFGVKMFLSELIPAFKGISQKLVPGARPAVEVQAFWPFGKNAVIIGLVSSFLGGLAAFGIIVGLRAIVPTNAQPFFPVMIPELIPHLYIGATAAIWANAYGGKKAAFIGAFCTGIMIEIIPVLMYDTGLMAPEIVNETNATFADPDMIVTPLVIRAIIGDPKVVHTTRWVLLALTALIYASPIIYNYVKPQGNKKNDEAQAKKEVAKVVKAKKMKEA